MGKSKKVTIGYWYAMGIHMGLCRGPIDTVVEVQVGDKVACYGAPPDFDTWINEPDLFGGKKKEGGLVPAFRGVTTAYWDGWLAAMNPYLKTWVFRVHPPTRG